MAKAGDEKEIGNAVTAEQVELLAQKALEQRPLISIRFRLMAGFLSFFLLAVVMIITTIIILQQLDIRMQFLVIADKYTNEIQQARRFEKNYFLYGTNLPDLLEHARTAQELLQSSNSELESVLGKNELNTMTMHLETYMNLLEQLKIQPVPGTQGEQENITSIESQLRMHGSQMVDYAFDLSAKERGNVSQMFTWVRRIPLIFLFFLLLLMIYFANLLTRQIIGRLTRLMSVTERIANGDFTPIMPERRYRDEFTNLNLALNHMMLELDRHQQKMIQSHKLLAVGNLTAGVAHELNNPINNITLTAAMLEEDYQQLSDDERLEMIHDLGHEAERSTQIVRNLLDFARESEMTTEQLDLKQLLNDTIRLAANQIKLSKVKAEINSKVNLPLIHGDRRQLQQVFLNLILNALDASPSGGTLKMTIERAQTAGYLEVIVKDSGSGIPQHILPRIFDPFFTTKPTGRGTGLGLSVSLGILKQHGGNIEAESTPGKGTSFTVLLPVAETPAELKEQADS
ncbi:sensor protein ZraS [bacterium BMS3Bbin04]|nr:sensor protein ZraS [bacterium BMS3Bbin04]